MSKNVQEPSIFDRFAGTAADIAGGAVFFILCVALVLIWLPSYFVFQNLNTWQLVINTMTTIVTFLLVALLQNSQRRTEEAMNGKLDALADGLADLMAFIGQEDREFQHDIEDLRSCIGSEAVGRR